ncbi:MAG: hypothetical protein AAF492_13245, partial [Verrucomicrobiota bacterium]
MKHLIALALLAGMAFPLQAQPNAALSYWQAFALLPDMNDDVRQELRDWATLELNDDVRKGVAGANMALDFAAKGARIEHCDWNVDWNAGFVALLPHLSKARLMSYVIGLKARTLLAVGDGDGAVDQLLNGLALARHTGTDRIFVSLLVQNLLEKGYHDFILAHLGHFNESQLTRLSAG